MPFGWWREPALGGYDIFIMRMNDRLTALRLFQRIAHAGSFSRAGRDMGMSQPSVSRIITALENDLGATLFRRTTRAVTLTEAGADYLARVEAILTALDEADHLVGGSGAVRGVLRVAVSSSFGVREVIPRLPDFLDRHPELRVDLLVSDVRQDLIAIGADLALRFGALPDSTARARRIGRSPRILTASPGYLQRRGSPVRPGDLADHDVIVGPGSAGPEAWSFADGGRRVSIAVAGRLRVAANEAAVAAAVAGLGITSTSIWGCGAELADGRLVRVLADWDAGSIDLHAVFPGGQPPRPAARAFVDFLATAIPAPSPAAPVEGVLDQVPLK